MPNNVRWRSCNVPIAVATLQQEAEGQEKKRFRICLRPKTLQQDSRYTIEIEIVLQQEDLVLLLATDDS